MHKPPRMRTPTCRACHNQKLCVVVELKQVFQVLYNACTRCGFLIHGLVYTSKEANVTDMKGLALVLQVTTEQKIKRKHQIQWKSKHQLNCTISYCLRDLFYLSQHFQSGSISQLGQLYSNKSQNSLKLLKIALFYLFSKTLTSHNLSHLAKKALKSYKGAKTKSHFELKRLAMVYAPF